jgi:uncharacterized repeat protein (TIGR03803 family)
MRRFISLSVLATIVLTLVGLPLAASAQSFSVLQNFANSNGNRPLSPPILASDGNLYGATLEGGANSDGLVYKLTPQNELTTLYAFCSQANCSDGSLPQFGPIQGKDGNLYGTTSNGGANNLGVVYELTLSGQLTVLHSFCLCDDGWDPNSLVEDGDGGFYGTTQQAGAYQNGTIFHLTAQGKLTTLYSFCGSQPNCTIDAYSNTGEPQPLIRATDGNLYGITIAGGEVSNESCSPYGCGTVFKVTPQGEFSIVYTFCSLADCSDGISPEWMLQGSDGNFYGTTGGGGTESTPGGTVFQLTPSGTLTTLYSFSASAGSASGSVPYDLIQASNGTLYGITFFGGNETGQCKSLGCGTVFSISESGAFASLHSFDFSDGYAPAGVVLTSNTTLAGTTSAGGTKRDGVIFSLNSN